MPQQILIIGLGQFGMSLARALSERGTEVLAVDHRKAPVEEASAFVAEALVVDGTDENELARLSPAKRDAAVCAIGDHSKEDSIVCTALLRQMGAPFVVARANDRMHRRILQMVGAHRIINPEQEFGERFATRLIFRNIIADTPIGDDLHLTEIRAQPQMVGKTLIDLAMPKRFGVIVAAIRRGSPSKLIQPTPDDPLREGDNLVIVSNEAAIARLVKGVK